LVLWSASFTAACCLSFSTPFLPLFARGLGASLAMIGLIFSVRDILQIFLRIPFGSLCDRLGRKPLIVLGLICFALTQLTFFLSRGLWLLVLGMLINGVALAFFYPAAQSCATELAPPDRLGETMGRFTMSLGFAYVIGPLIGGFLAEAFPLYRPIFLMSCTLTSIGAVATLILLRETLPFPSSTGWTDEVRVFGRLVKEVPGTLCGMFTNRRILVSSVTVFVSSFGIAALESYYPLHATHIGLDESLIGASLALRSLLWAFSMPYLGRLSDKIGRRLPMAAGLTMCAIGSALVPATREYPVLLVALALIGLGGGLHGPASQAGIAEGADSSRRGVGMGLVGTMLMGGRGIGMFTAGLVVSLLDLAWAFYLAALAASLGVAVVLLVRRRSG